MMSFVHVLTLAAVLTLGVVVAAPLEEVVITATDADISDEFEINLHLDNENIIFGDIQIDPHRNAVHDNHRWPNGQIPYTIDSAFPTDIHDKIITVMREIESNVNPSSGNCIKFVPRTTQANYLEIHIGTGCHAIIGMSGNGAQEVSLGDGCEAKGIIMHELMHAVGFWHEQNRYDRDTYINIDLSNVDPDHQSNFRSVSSSTIQLLNTAYDFGSIMHYNPYTWGLDKSTPVLTPKPGKIGAGIQMGQRLGLSTLDVTRVQRLYDCPEDTSHIFSPLSPDDMVDCNFANGWGICGFSADTSASLQWTVKSGTSPSQHPKAGNTNGADPYILATSSSSGIARLISSNYNKGDVCLDFFVYQNGPSSYLSLVADGPGVSRTTFKTYQGYNHDQWYHRRVHLNVPSGLSFHVEFEAHIISGDVAVDDIHIYQGDCI